MKTNTSKRFIMIFIISLCTITIGYPLIYHSLVTPDQLINHSYKDFLLRYTQSPRLIIDSGSNSTYGINSDMLEKELGILTINLSDNAGYPLREKLYRIEKFAHQGDIILLPLEWPHYFYTNIPWFFLENLFTELAFYYHEMPSFIKLDLLAKLPFSSAMRILFKKLSRPAYVKPTQTEYETFISYRLKFKQHARGDAKEAITTGHNQDKKMTCNEYIFGKGLGYDVITNGFVISTLFKQNIELIKKLQAKGIQVLLTSPTVASEDCYQGQYAAHFQAFITNLKQYLAQNNILFIGKPEDSRFAKRYLFNSYYHVIAIARDTHTQRLINTIQHSSAQTWFKKSIPQQPALTLTPQTVESYMIKQLLNNASAGIVDNQLITVADKNNLFLASGWYPLENWGVWSENTASVIYVKLNQRLLQTDIKLIIDNVLFGTKDDTTLLINDKQLGHYFLDGKKSLLIPQQLLANTHKGLIKIEFRHHYVKPPVEYGHTLETRHIKFGLKSLQFSRLAL